MTASCRPAPPRLPLRQMLSEARWTLIFCVILAAVIRIDFLIASDFVIDADEAIVGLMAKHILEGGPIPTFYYGQHYMGSLEALLVAAAFAVFGASHKVLVLVPCVISLFLIPLLYLITREISSLRAGRMAALLTAIPPVTLITWSSKPRGGFIEVVCLGALALWVTMRWLKNEEFLLREIPIIGLILGVGWWVNNQILYFMAPIGLWIALGVCSFGARGIVKRACAALVGGIAAFLLGGLPFWVYQIQNDYASFGLFGSSSWKEIAQHFEGVWELALPILLGAQHSWQAEDIYPFATWIVYATAALILVPLVIARRGKIARLCFGKFDRHQPVELLAAFIALTIAIFCISSFGWLVQAPRYLLPLYVALLPLFATGLDQITRWSPAFASVLSAALLIINLSSAYLGGRAIPGEPVVYGGERVSRDHREILAWLDQQKIEWIRTNYWIGYRLAFESNERVRFRVFGEPRTTRIAHYQREVEKFDKDLLPMVLVPKEWRSIEPAIIKLGVTYDVAELSNYVVVYNLRYSREPLHRRLVPRDVLHVHASRKADEASRAIDADTGTRWGTGESQRPGQEFVISISQPRKLIGFRMRFAGFYTDFPRLLEVLIRTSDGREESLLNASDYAALRYYVSDDEEFRLEFSPVVAQSLVFRQVGKDPVFDWSIAEIELYEEAN